MIQMEEENKVFSDELRADQPFFKIVKEIQEDRKKGLIYFIQEEVWNNPKFPIWMKKEIQEKNEKKKIF